MGSKDKWPDLHGQLTILDTGRATRQSDVYRQRDVGLHPERRGSRAPDADFLLDRGHCVDAGFEVVAPEPPHHLYHHGDARPVVHRLARE
jgi:hypothetical protein